MFSLENPAPAAQLVEQIVSILEKDPSPQRLIQAAGIGWNVLTLLAATAAQSRGNDPLDRAQRYLAARLDTPVTLAELAAHARVSPSHLGALFRASVGVGPLTHHRTLRMARARQLLDGTDDSIAKVARATGYPDQLYFSRQFRQTHGLSPTAYRNQSKG